MSIKHILKKIWHFIWVEDSVLSWIVNVILAFIIIKFLVYPGLGFVLGTTHPIVAVVSSSMEHPTPTFDEWWSDLSCCKDHGCNSQFSQGEKYLENGISKNLFKSFTFNNGFNKGDIMILYSSKNTEIGDVLVFQSETRPDPIIHRTIKIDNNKYTTKGDNNCVSAGFEKDITQEKIIGKAVLKIPLLGWIKILFVDSLKFIGGLI